MLSNNFRKLVLTTILTLSLLPAAAMAQQRVQLGQLPGISMVTRQESAPPIQQAQQVQQDVIPAAKAQRLGHAYELIQAMEKDDKDIKEYRSKIDAEPNLKAAYKAALKAAGKTEADSTELAAKLTEAFDKSAKENLDKVQRDRNEKGVQFAQEMNRRNLECGKSVEKDEARLRSLRAEYNTKFSKAKSDSTEVETIQDQLAKLDKDAKDLSGTADVVAQVNAANGLATKDTEAQLSSTQKNIAEISRKKKELQDRLAKLTNDSGNLLNGKEYKRFGLFKSKDKGLTELYDTAEKLDQEVNSKKVQCITENLEADQKAASLSAPSGFAQSVTVEDRNSPSALAQRLNAPESAPEVRRAPPIDSSLAGAPVDNVD